MLENHKILKTTAKSILVPIQSQSIQITLFQELKTEERVKSTQWEAQRKVVKA